MASNNITLGYWNIRGKAGLLRALLSYTGLSYTNKVYTDHDEWFAKDKQNLGFDYPNLPYLIDGDKKLTETNAIAYYIPIRAGKRELIGDTDDKFTQVQIVYNAIYDLKGSLVSLALAPGEFQANKVEAFAKGSIPIKLGLFDKNLEGKEWLTGFLSVADFALFESLELIDQMDGKALETYPNLHKFIQRFREVPEIKAYQASDKNCKSWFGARTKF